MSSRDNVVRAILAIMGILGALFGPYWIAPACILLLSLRFRAWEAPLIGLLTDFLWLPSVGYLHPFPLVTVLALALVWAFEPLRREFLIS